jgi:hypothetical protein
MVMEPQFGASGQFRIRDIISNAKRITVRAQCQQCGTITDLNWAALALSYSEEKSLRSLARNIRCQSCGAHGCRWLVSLTLLDPTLAQVSRQRRAKDANTIVAAR